MSWNCYALPLLMVHKINQLNTLTKPEEKITLSIRINGLDFTSPPPPPNDRDTGMSKIVGNA